MTMLRHSRFLACTVIAAMAILSASSAMAADEQMARNVITTATGKIPDLQDPNVRRVATQLENIRTLCAATSKGADIGDKVAFSHSNLKVREPIFSMLSGIEEIARRQCAHHDSGTLLALYVLERNDGSSHSNTVAVLARNPTKLIRKWESRPAGK